LPNCGGLGVSEVATEQNIVRYADLFCHEIDFVEQGRTRALLVGEEKRFGFHSEQLDRVDLHIDHGRGRVVQQRALVDRLERRGGDARVAVALLAGLVELVDLFERYRNLILDALDRNQLTEPGYNGDRSHPHGLTRREIEVIHHVSYGRSSRQIADLLGLTERTVSGHRDAIYAKLGVATRTMAVAAAFRAGVLAGHAG
jgi:DNA-binding CsgD family transcriptional regulator